MERPGLRRRDTDRISPSNVEHDHGPAENPLSRTAREVQAADLVEADPAQRLAVRAPAFEAERGGTDLQQACKRGAAVLPP